MYSSILIAVAACLLAIFLLKRMFSRGNLAPGPIGLPFLGYIPFLSTKPYLDFQRLAKKYGDVFSLQLGSAYVVVLNDFESAKEAFSKDALMGRPEDIGFKFNKESIETEAFHGLPWKEQRKFCVHMLRDLGLGKSKMEQYIQEEIGEFLEVLEQKAEQPFHIYELLAPSMSNNIASLLFGKRMKYSDPERQMLTRIVKELVTAGGQAAWQLFFPTVKKICEFLGIGNVSRGQKELKDYVMSEMKKHESTLSADNVRDFIDGYLLEIEKRKNPSFCKPFLQDIGSIFFIGGSETVQMSVEWLLLMAAQYPDRQRRIQSEIDEVIGQSQYATWPDQKSMPYTQAFITELMRWRTIVPLNVIRYALADSEIGGYFIPKHTHILSNLWAVHHNPKYFGQDAEEFRPERFLTEDGQGVKKSEYFIPFSIGKRACPGEPLAKIEIFLYFTSILQRFNITVPKGKVLDLEGQLGGGLMPKSQELIFTKRN